MSCRPHVTLRVGTFTQAEKTKVFLLLFLQKKKILHFVSPISVCAFVFVVTRSPRMAGITKPSVTRAAFASVILPLFTSIPMAGALSTDSMARMFFSFSIISAARIAGLDAAAMKGVEVSAACVGCVCFPDVSPYALTQIIKHDTAAIDNVVTRCNRLLRCHCEIVPRRWLEIRVYLCCRIAAVADRPHHQTGTAHNIAGGEHAR